MKSDFSQELATTRVLIVAPFLHRPGHTASFPVDLAAGLSLAGVKVTIVCPIAPMISAVFPRSTAKIETLILENLFECRSGVVRWLWRRVAPRPFVQSLVGLAFGDIERGFDLTFFTDTEPGVKSGFWYLQLIRLFGRAGRRLAFTEHYDYAWNASRFSRWTGSDRLRLRGIEMFCFSKHLLDMNRRAMNWKDVGHYVPWGVWPSAQSGDQRLQARVRLNLDADARVLLVFGVLSIRRKSVDKLADALRDIDLCKPLQVVFAGPRACDSPHPFDDTKLKERHQLSIRRDERFIPDDQVETYFAAADAVWANYGNFAGASGVLSQAMGFGRIPIASDAGEIGQLCRLYECGLLSTVNDMISLRASLDSFICMSAFEQFEMERAAITAGTRLSWDKIGRLIMQKVISES